VLTLALRIAANTTIFSTVDALILHPFLFSKSAAVPGVVGTKPRGGKHSETSNWQKPARQQGAQKQSPPLRSGFRLVRLAEARASARAPKTKPSLTVGLPPGETGRSPRVSKGPKNKALPYGRASAW
jgi:hypothetical protein